MGNWIFRSASLLVVLTSCLPSLASAPAKTPAKAAKPAAPPAVLAPAPVPPDLQGAAMVTPDVAQADADRTVGELVTERYRDGKVKIERRVIQDSDGNYVNHGPYTFFDPQGKIIRSGEFRNGKQHGKWTHRFSQDQGYLFSGLNEKTLTGPFLSEANFVDGQLHGAWTIKDAKGQLIVQWTFERDVANGVWNWWFPSGQKRLEANYRDGKLNGDMKEWDTAGKSVLDRTYVDGKWLDKVVGWHAPGQKAYEGYYLRVATIPEPKYNWWNATATPGSEPTGEDERHAQWVSWHPNGNKKSTWSYDHDVLIGRITWWYENGQTQADGSYDAGQKAGTWITWHANGLKESEGEFKAGQLVGQFTRWDESGKLVELREPSKSGTQPQNVGDNSTPRGDYSADRRFGQSSRSR